MSIENDTDLMPWLIGETVVERVIQHFYGKPQPRGLDDLDRKKTEVAEHLAKFAERVYAKNTNFAKKIRGRGDSGRDTLYVFMEHWLASYLKNNYPSIYKALPVGYGYSFSFIIEANKSHNKLVRASRKRNV